MTHIEEGRLCCKPEILRVSGRVCIHTIVERFFEATNNFFKKLYLLILYAMYSSPFWAVFLSIMYGCQLTVMLLGENC